MRGGTKKKNEHEGEKRKKIVTKGKYRDRNTTSFPNLRGKEDPMKKARDENFKYPVRKDRDRSKRCGRIQEGETRRKITMVVMGKLEGLKYLT